MRKLIYVIFLLMIPCILIFFCKNNSLITQEMSKVPILKDFISKKDVKLNESVEGTPFVWKGKLLYLVTEREIFDKKRKISVYDFKTNIKLATFGSNLGLASALVDNNLLYIFATRKFGKLGESEIVLITTNDLKNYSEPVVVYKAQKNQSFFNTSVTKNSDTGKYVMALETDEGSFVAFTIRLLESSDLKNWSQIPNAIFGKDVYVACPSIRYINNQYYMWFLMEEYNDPNCIKCLTYVVKIARSDNLVDWKVSPHYFLVPDRVDEGTNTSDLDLTEFNGKVYILYSVGDQATWSEMRYAEYNSTLKNLVKNYF